MPKIRPSVPLTEEHLKQAPHGDPKCRLCQLSPEQLEDLNHKKFDEKLTYKSLRPYIKEKYKLGVDFTEINMHFNKHVLGKHVLAKILEKRKEIKYPEVVRALEPLNSEIKVVTSNDLEKAYESLVKMAQTFVSKVRKLQDKIALAIDTRDENKELDEELDRVSALDLLEKLAKINKEARDFVKEVSALRAPKVMVAQLLESFIDNVIRELSVIVNNICGELQYEITMELQEAGHADAIKQETFVNIFRKAAIDYRDRMINLKRQQLSDAMAALQDLEKII